MASTTRKYATLPDLDSAPDIYETPELVDDLSTLQTSTARSSSPEASDADDGQETTNEERNISHQHLHPDQARTRFSSARVDARDVDFSDRVDERRRSYRTSFAKHGIEDEDDEEEDEEERVRRKLARLKREVEDIKEVVERRKLEREKGGEGGHDDVKEKQQKTFAGLVDLVANLKRLSTAGEGAEAELKRQLARKAIIGEQVEQLSSATTTTTINPPIPTPPSIIPPSSTSSLSSIALERASILETRLTKLETLLGLTSSSTSTPLFPPNQPPTPLLPTLTYLNRQVSILSRLLSTPNQLPAHITSLLDRLQSQSHPRTSQPPQATPESQKIEQIYTHLSTLDNLTPLLPPLLNRLESLHQIHMRAAGAEQALDEAETVQAQLGREIETWRTGVERLEDKMRKNEEVLKSNAAFVESWVRRLEERVEKLDGGSGGGGGGGG